MALIGTLHTKFVHSRRVQKLTSHLAELIPPSASVLDVGCGDGKLARLLMDVRPDLKLQGVDVLIRPDTHVPVTEFDGERLPMEDGSVDVVMFIDVLHHTTDPMVLLREAVRVARQAVVIKDHTVAGIIGRPLLRFMDWMGNARYGVAIPGNYWKLEQWQQAFAEVKLQPAVWKRALGLYPWWANWFFGHGLHFMTTLTKTSKPIAAEVEQSQPADRSALLPA